MSEHTPGPWSASQPDMFGDITITGNQEVLAIGAVCNGEMRRMGGKLNEHLANARLIVAAPELLSELRHVLSAYVLPERKTCGEAASDGERIKSLIARATGNGNGE